jgi:rubrerythrin
VAYGHFIELAENMGDVTASNILSNSRDVEDGHAKLYKYAINHLIGEKETTYYVYQVCGYVSDGVLPEVCPICSAPKDQFVNLNNPPTFFPRLLPEVLKVRIHIGIPDFQR